MAKQSKKEVERVKAEAHKQQLRAVKAARRQEPALIRNTPSLEEKPIILIYCEGRNTEPSYFNKFRVSTVTIKAFGEGKNTLSLVKSAKAIEKKKKKSGKPFEKIWCVFDADPKSDNPTQLKNFNKAVQLTKKFGYGVAYSNQAFEYWLLLHFEDHQGAAMPRTDYTPKLNGYLKTYELFYDGAKSKTITKEFFELLFEVIGKTPKGEHITRTDKAIIRAKRIYDLHGDHNDPGREESSTTVYKLVEELLFLERQDSDNN